MATPKFGDKVQMRLYREARRVGDASELVPFVVLAGKLLDEGYSIEYLEEALNVPVQGNVTKRHRLVQAAAMTKFWPEGVFASAERYDADWSALWEPAEAFEQGKLTDRGPVLEYVTEWIGTKGRWPSAEALRRKFRYREPGHKLPGERNPGQGTLGAAA